MVTTFRDKISEIFYLVVVPREEHRRQRSRRTSEALHGLRRKGKTIGLASHLVVSVGIHSGLEPPIRRLFPALGGERLLTTDSHRIIHVPLAHVNSNHRPVNSILSGDESLKVVIGVDVVTRTGPDLFQGVGVGHSSILVSVERKGIDVTKRTAREVEPF